MNYPTRLLVCAAVAVAGLPRNSTAEVQVVVELRA